MLNSASTSCKLEQNSKPRFAEYKLLALGFLFLLKISSTQANPSSKSWTGSDTYVHKSSLESEKYSSLPHTIFSPDGRLYNIERNARSASDSRDLSSSLVLAFKFGPEDDESIIMLSTGTTSPHLYNSMNSNTDKEKEKDKDDKNVEDDNYEPLWSHPTSIQKDHVSMPLSILPSNIIIGTGGTAADSISLHKKIRELGLSLYRENDNMRSTHRIEGTVLSSTLAKKIAATLQLPTQSAASNRMVASAAIVVGPDVGGGNKQSIWRCDATGQFYNCHASAVGRGAGSAEAMLMSQVLEKGKGGSADKTELEDLISAISPRDVKEYLSTLSFDDAVLLACKCIVKALNLSNKDDAFDRIGMQGIWLNRRKGQSAMLNQECIHGDILRRGLKLAFEV